MAAAETVVKNLVAVLKHIAELSVQHAVDVRLVAVSKTFPADHIFACYQHGQRHFGESYVEEFEAKARELVSRNATDILWHYIGRLQSKKIKKICSVPGLWCVETVDSRKHSDILQSTIAVQGRNLNVFIQVNTSGEKNKGGVEPSELAGLAKHILQNCPNLNLLGLMTIGSLVESKNPDENADFELLRKLRGELAEQLERPLELSMGMSTDYPLAIKYGSTSVRVGSTIFGQRIYPEKE